LTIPRITTGFGSNLKAYTRLRRASRRDPWGSQDPALAFWMDSNTFETEGTGSKMGGSVRRARFVDLCGKPTRKWEWFFVQTERGMGRAVSTVRLISSIFRFE